MNHAETKRPVSRIARLLVACALVAIAGSCRSPVSMSGADGGTADFSIRFLVSGTNRDASRADPDSARPRLILPSADTLTVTLTATDGGGDPIASTSAISGTTSSVYFGEVPFGSYEIRAEAFGGGAVRFRQVSTITVAATDVELTLNLLPTDAEVLETVTQYSLSVAELAPDASMSWGIPTGSGLLAADSMYVEGLVSDCHVFLQDADGRLLGEATASGRLVSSSLPKDRPSYITFYNGGSDPVTLSAFAGPAMVDVPAGTFQRDATITNTSYVSAFSMGKYEVTQAQYLTVMDGEDNSSIPALVSWYHAIAFCNKLSILEGLTPVYSVTVGGTEVAWAVLSHGDIPTVDDANWSAASVNLAANGYRLPTEMEWLWSAMGATEDRSNGYDGVGTNTQGIGKLFAGSSGSNDSANYVNDGVSTRPVGELLPNELGLYDMSGNVYEWCWDRMGAYPDGPLVDYFGAQTGGRMTLGGSWGDDRAINYRYSQNPWLTGASNLGFRVARGVLPTYTVSYHANGATSGAAPAPVLIMSGQAHTILDNIGVLVGPQIIPGVNTIFSSWNTRSDGSGVSYSPEESIPVVDKDLTLYARYSTIGAAGPGGGVIFYDAGNYDLGWRYMEITSTNFPNNATWGPSGEEVGGTQQGIGYGKENTDLFIARYPSGSYAANVCVDYRGGGLSDWFLPSYHEIHEYRILTFNTLAIDGDYDGYWTSSEASDSGANNYTTFGLENSSRGKTLALKVRAVRRF